MFIKYSTYKKIIREISSHPIESGGIIGYKKKVFCSFEFDNVSQGGNCFVPNVQKLNETIKYWAKNKVSFGGIVHSHPNGFYKLSEQDVRYAQKIIVKNNLKTIYFPIVAQNKRGKFNLFVYCIREDLTVKREKLIIVL